MKVEVQGSPWLLQPFLSSLVCGLPEVLDTGSWQEEAGGCASPLPSPPTSPQDTSPPTCSLPVPCHPRGGTSEKRPETSKKQGLVPGPSSCSLALTLGKSCYTLGLGFLSIKWEHSCQVHTLKWRASAAATGTAVGELPRAAPSPPGHCGPPPVCIHCPQRRK